MEINQILIFYSLLRARAHSHRLPYSSAVLWVHGPLHAQILKARREELQPSPTQPRLLQHDLRPEPRIFNKVP